MNRRFYMIWNNPLPCPAAEPGAHTAEKNTARAKQFKENVPKIVKIFTARFFHFTDGVFCPSYGDSAANLNSGCIGKKMVLKYASKNLNK